MLEVKYLPDEASKKVIESAFVQAGEQLARVHLGRGALA